jgi:thiamine biosynthesis lipoprotein
VRAHREVGGGRFVRVIALLIVATAIACSPAAEDAADSATLIERTGVAMGSSLAVTALSDDGKAAARAIQLVFDDFAAVEERLSVWKPGSDIERINAAAGRAPVVVSPETIEVLELAIEAGDRTGGKFDATFGVLSGLWKFDHDQDNSFPDPAAIAQRLPLIDYEQIVIDRTVRTAFLKRAGMRLHLGGIGKGFAIDRAAGILRAHGLQNFMIQAGGDLYVAGRRYGRPWRVAIRDPRGPADRLIAALDLTDGTFSTSGDYERFFMHHGTRYHHILDPDSGQPARGLRSVTVVAERAVDADTLSTGIFVMGAEKGMALVERLPGVDAVLVTDRNDVLVSSRLKGRLIRLAEPTDAP